MKLKIPNWFNNIDKRLQKLEPHAKYFVWWFGIILATASVASVSNILNPTNRVVIWICLFLFIFAGLIVSISDLRRSKQNGTEIPSKIEQPGRNRWVSIVILALAVIILVPIFARQLLPVPQEYQAFLTAFAATGAWVTGIALALFTYQQYKLRQTEHRLLFEPQIVLSGGSPKIGLGVFNNKKYPYRIEWPVFIYNTSQMPVLIEYMQVRVKLAGEDSGREGLISPTYCHVVEPENLSEQFEVTLTKPCHITWIVEGSSAGDVFDYVSGDSGKRDFVLIFRVIDKRPQDPEEAIFPRETVSWPIHVPKDANWGPSTPYVIEGKGNI